MSITVNLRHNSQSDLLVFIVYITVDSSVSIDEFLAYRKKQFEQDDGKPMSEFEINFERIQFKSLDADKSGSVDYNEFMKHQASKKLAIKEGVRR